LKNIREYSIDTQCVHAGLHETNEGALVTPIYQTSTFKFDNAEQGSKLFKGEQEGYIYTRMRNPTVEAMECAVAILEGGTRALGCASGMAAVHTLLTAALKAGDHVICSESCYGATSTLLATIMPNFGITTTFVDTSNLDEVRAAIKHNTKLIFAETPGNPTVVMCDLEEIGKIAKSIGAKFAVDNTFMSPILQKPFDFGADYIIHSMTKYLNGHADVVAGIIILNDESEYPHFRRILNHLGGTIDPFNSFLVHRGLKTLKIRVEEQQRNAIKIAEYLENHQKIEWIRYPGLPSHPQFDLAKKQMTGPGSMIAFELKGGLEAGRILMDNIELFVLAVSLGGVESLIQHPASMTHAGMSPDARKQAQITDGLVRISIGIENADDLINALKKGLDLIN